MPTFLLFSQNVAVPGGQEVYVDKTGAHAYTVAQSHAVPNGGQTTSFGQSGTSSEGGSISDLLFHGVPSPGWLACPYEVNNIVEYQIYADISGVQVSGTSVTHCHDIAIALVPSNATAIPYQFS